MVDQIIFAGFGGQGIQSMSKILTLCAMEAEKEVTWMPSYGGAMRGGTSNVTVIISDEMIGSPMSSPGEASIVVAMNNPSLIKFESYLAPGGLLFVNSSLIDEKPARSDIVVIPIPVSKMADEMKDSRVANMIMLGALLEQSGIVETQILLDLIETVFAKTPQVIERNRSAAQKGIDWMKANGKAGLR